ncbi:hypothetical protein MVEN_00306000 [Mycena venus]|uniref:Uncharacterized protein n=1 Tax=Mycena venus TaxID=2733690 RepID=A0A8H6Z063_9AGAR|nr:hypothetical protein MVEN_00306000 [Mycena venus]
MARPIFAVHNDGTCGIDNLTLDMRSHQPMSPLHVRSILAPASHMAQTNTAPLPGFMTT